jgi:hypothetical protein
MSLDAIRLQLQQPIDWARFEALVCELLQGDDLPNLRKLGGVADDGADGVHESFFDSATIETIVVQVTSEVTQSAKFNRTVKRLKETKTDFDRLVIVYQQPVDSSVRRLLQESAKAENISLDIRDESYLLPQLSRQNAIYQRYFGTPSAQLKVLLGKSDPLGLADKAPQRAVLAALGTYVCSPARHSTRRTLYDNTVLAAIASKPDGLSRSELETAIAELLPEVRSPRAQIEAALERLHNQGKAHVRKDSIRASSEQLQAFAETMTLVRGAFDALSKHVDDRAVRGRDLDQATRGRLHRNLQRALAALFRAGAEPIDDSSRGVLPLMAEGIDRAVAQRALLAVHEYISDTANANNLAILTRSYAALCVRNLDPLGRAWQQQELRRSQLVLDTDVVLMALVEDLPESEAIQTALRGLVKAGVTLMISDSVFAEVVGHVERAYNTYNKFSATLRRMSPDMVDGRVWHAVVRGYYYAARASTKPIAWQQYYASYYRKDRAADFVAFVLRRRIEFQLGDPGPVSQQDHADIETIAKDLVPKEEKRLKAEFRQPEDQERRAVEDIRLAVSTASATTGSARGYLVSADGGFRVIERHSAWKPRPRVHVFTKLLSTLFEFVCGTDLDSGAIVRLFFDPVVAAAAQLMSREIDALTSAGVRFDGHSIASIEWDLREQMTGIVLADPDDGADDDTVVLRAIRVAQIASAKGYALEPVMDKIIKNHDALKEALEYERDLRTAAEHAVEAVNVKTRESLKAVTTAAVGQTKRGRNRVRVALRKQGYDLDEFLRDDEAPSVPPLSGADPDDPEEAGDKPAP